MTNTENKFKHNGVWYKAIDSVSVCEGCAGEFDDKLCAKSPSCYDFERIDKREVIFVKSDADNFGDE